MKKSVKSLLPRRRTRAARLVFPVLIIVVLLFALLLFVVFFTNGPGAALFYTATPTASNTSPPTATPSPVPATETPAATDTATVTAGPSPTPTPLVHVVAEGESLYSISISYTESLNYPVTIAAIIAANGLPGEIIGVGQSLIIPGPGQFPTATPSPIPTGLARGARIQYTVRPNDSLEALALQFASTVAEISRLNNGITSADLRAGQVITIPVGIATNTPTPAAATITAQVAASQTAQAVATTVGGSVTATVTPTPP